MIRAIPLLVSSLLACGVAAAAFSWLAPGAQNARAQPPAPYKNSALPVEQRVDDLLGRMTPQEKAQMLSG